MLKAIASPSPGIAQIRSYEQGDAGFNHVNLEFVKTHHHIGVWSTMVYQPRLHERIAHNTRSSRGVVRYIGAVAGKAGTWVGIELENAEGRNDGAVGGQRYFSCQPMHGTFVQSTVFGRLWSASAGTSAPTAAQPSNGAAAGAAAATPAPRASSSPAASSETAAFSARRRKPNSRNPSRASSRRNSSIGDTESFSGVGTNITQLDSESLAPAAEAAEASAVVAQREAQAAASLAALQVGIVRRLEAPRTIRRLMEGQGAGGGLGGGAGDPLLWCAVRGGAVQLRCSDGSTVQLRVRLRQPRGSSGDGATVAVDDTGPAEVVARLVALTPGRLWAADDNGVLRVFALPEGLGSVAVERRSQAAAGETRDVSLALIDEIAAHRKPARALLAVPPAVMASAAASAAAKAGEAGSGWSVWSSSNDGTIRCYCGLTQQLLCVVQAAALDHARVCSLALCTQGGGGGNGAAASARDQRVAQAQAQAQRQAVVWSGDERGVLRAWAPIVRSQSGHRSTLQFSVQPLGQLEAHRGAVLALASVQLGGAVASATSLIPRSLLLSASDDGTVRVWARRGANAAVGEKGASSWQCMHVLDAPRVAAAEDFDSGAAGAAGGGSGELPAVLSALTVLRCALTGRVFVVSGGSGLPPVLWLLSAQHYSWAGRTAGGDSLAPPPPPPPRVLLDPDRGDPRGSPTALLLLARCPQAGGSADDSPFALALWVATSRRGLLLLSLNDPTSAAAAVEAARVLQDRARRWIVRLRFLAWLQASRRALSKLGDECRRASLVLDGVHDEDAPSTDAASGTRALDSVIRDATERLPWGGAHIPELTQARALRARLAQMPAQAYGRAHSVQKSALVAPDSMTAEDASAFETRRRATSDARFVSAEHEFRAMVGMVKSPETPDMAAQQPPVRWTEGGRAAEGRGGGAARAVPSDADVRAAVVAELGVPEHAPNHSVPDPSQKAGSSAELEHALKQVTAWRAQAMQMKQELRAARNEIEHLQEQLQAARSAPGPLAAAIDRSGIMGRQQQQVLRAPMPLPPPSAGLSGFSPERMSWALSQASDLRRRLVEARLVLASAVKREDFAAAADTKAQLGELEAASRAAEADVATQERLRREEEERVRREAEEQARAAAVEQARREAEERARQEAEEKARREALEDMRRRLAVNEEARRRLRADLTAAITREDFGLCVELKGSLAELELEGSKEREALVALCSEAEAAELQAEEHRKRTEEAKAKRDAEERLVREAAARATALQAAESAERAAQQKAREAAVQRSEERARRNSLERAKAIADEAAASERTRSEEAVAAAAASKAAEDAASARKAEADKVAKQEADAATSAAALQEAERKAAAAKAAEGDAQAAAATAAAQRKEEEDKAAVAGAAAAARKQEEEAAATDALKAEADAAAKRAAKAVEEAAAAARKAQEQAAAAQQESVSVAPSGTGNAPSFAIEGWLRDQLDEVAPAPAAQPQAGSASANPPQRSPSTATAPAAKPAVPAPPPPPPRGRKSSKAKLLKSPQLAANRKVAAQDDSSAAASPLQNFVRMLPATKSQSSLLQLSAAASQPPPDQSSVPATAVSTVTELREQLSELTARVKVRLRAPPLAAIAAVTDPRPPLSVAAQAGDDSAETMGELDRIGKLYNAHPDARRTGNAGVEQAQRALPPAPPANGSPVATWRDSTSMERVQSAANIVAQGAVSSRARLFGKATAPPPEGKQSAPTKAATATAAPAASKPFLRRRSGTAGGAKANASPTPAPSPAAAAPQGRRASIEAIRAKRGSVMSRAAGFGKAVAAVRSEEEDTSEAAGAAEQAEQAEAARAAKAAEAARAAEAGKAAEAAKAERAAKAAKAAEAGKAAKAAKAAEAAEAAEAKRLADAAAAVEAAAVAEAAAEAATEADRKLKEQEKEALASVSRDRRGSMERLRSKRGSVMAAAAGFQKTISTVQAENVSFARETAGSAKRKAEQAKKREADDKLAAEAARAKLEAEAKEGDSSRRGSIEELRKKRGSVMEKMTAFVPNPEAPPPPPPPPKAKPMTKEERKKQMQEKWKRKKSNVADAAAATKATPSAPRADVQSSPSVTAQRAIVEKRQMQQAEQERAIAAEMLAEEQEAAEEEKAAAAVRAAKKAEREAAAAAAANASASAAATAAAAAVGGKVLPAVGADDGDGTDDEEDDVPSAKVTGRPSAAFAAIAAASVSSGPSGRKMPALLAPPPSSRRPSMRPSIDPSKRPSITAAPAAAPKLEDLNILELREQLNELTQKVAEGDESQATMDAYDKVRALVAC